MRGNSTSRSTVSQYGQFVRPRQDLLEGRAARRRVFDLSQHTFALVADLLDLWSHPATGVSNGSALSL